MKKIRRQAAKAVEEAGGTSSLKSDAQSALAGARGGKPANLASQAFKSPAAKSGAGGKRSQHR